MKLEVRVFEGDEEFITLDRPGIYVVGRYGPEEAIVVRRDEGPELDETVEGLLWVEDPDNLVSRRHLLIKLEMETETLRGGDNRADYNATVEDTSSGGTYLIGGNGERIGRMVLPIGSTGFLIPYKNLHLNWQPYE